MNKQIRVGDSKYGTFDDTFYPLSPLSHKSPNFALQIVFFARNLTVLVIIDAHCAKYFYTIWVRGVAYQKQLSGPKLVGVLAREHVKIWDPLFISTTVEAINFKFGIQLGLKN